jgi:hypothetical protein
MPARKRFDPRSALPGSPFLKDFLNAPERFYRHLFSQDADG